MESNRISRARRLPIPAKLLSRMPDQRRDGSDETTRTDQRRPIPRWGYLLSSALLVLIVYGLYRFAIGLGFAWSISF